MSEAKIVFYVVFLPIIIFFSIDLYYSNEMVKECESDGGVSVRGICFNKDAIITQGADDE